MSYNYSSYAQPFTDEQIAAIQQISSGVYANKKQTTVWYRPELDQYFLALNPASQDPDYGIAITKPHMMKAAKQAIAKMGGSAMMDSTALDKWIYAPIKNEFLGQAVGLNERLNQLQRQFEQTGDEAALVSGGTITMQDYPALADVMIDTTVEEIVVNDFVILDAFNRKPWDKTTYTFDSKTPFRNTYRLGELDTADSRSISYGRGSINLMKAEGRVSVSIWVKMAIRQHDIEGDNTSMIDQDWDRGFSDEASTVLQTFTNQAAAGAYDVLAGGAFYHTTNPMVRFETDTLSIRAAGAEADTLIMNSKTYRILTDNAWMRTNSATIFGETEPFQKKKSRRVTNSKLPGFQILIDELVPTGSIIIMARKAVQWLDGPRSNRIVESNMGQIVDTVHDRWYAGGVKFSGMGVEETGTVT